jgi:hypothetical protein
MPVAPDITDRMAKLLRLACCETAPDGERLAAVTRLSATAAAHDICWDRALSGSGPTRDQMQELFDAGYERGLADGRAETQPEWSAVADPKSHERVAEILKAAVKAAEVGALNEWEMNFSRSVRERFLRYGRRLHVSPKMWNALDRLETKLKFNEFID